MRKDTFKIEIVIDDENDKTTVNKIVFDDNAQSFVSKHIFTGRFIDCKTLLDGMIMDMRYNHILQRNR